MSDDIVDRLHRAAMAAGAGGWGGPGFDILWDAKLEIEKLRARMAELEKQRADLGWQIEYERSLLR